MEPEIVKEFALTILRVMGWHELFIWSVRPTR